MDIDAWTGQPVSDSPWAPPKKWTAWPLRAGLLPPDDFVKRTEDEDEAFTFRRVELEEAPSSKLEQVVSAAILRCAKDNFRKRTFNDAQTPAQEKVNIKKEALLSANESSPDEEDSEEKMDLGENSAASSRRKKEDASQMTFRPAIATDDDLSYEIIRPSARSILQKLDQTLTVLHNTRVTSTQNLVDAAEVTSSEDEYLYDEATPRRHSRSRASSRASAGTAMARSRSASTGAGEISHAEMPTITAKERSNRGRRLEAKPRKGETEREFLLRRAKEQKKKQPMFPDEESGGDGNSTTAAELEDAKSPAYGREQRERLRRRRSRPGPEDIYWIKKRLARLNLRDWSDVMGAAALAGFSPRVVKKATQRCADLFGEGMDIHTIPETTATSSHAGDIKTRRYLPGGEISSESEAEEEDGGLDLVQARSISRMSSAVPSRAASLDSDGESARDSPSRKRQKRSTSRGSAVGHHYCPHADCERAYRGFARGFNLKRHMKLVHGGGESSGSGEVKTQRVVTETDLLDGVHRDGFLEPIRVQKGWRVEHGRKRERKQPPVKGRRDESPDQEDTGFGSKEDSSAQSVSEAEA